MTPIEFEASPILIAGDGRDVDEEIHFEAAPPEATAVIIDTPVRIFVAGDTQRRGSGRTPVAIEARLEVGAPGNKPRTRQWLGTQQSATYVDGSFLLDRMILPSLVQRFTRGLDVFRVPWTLRVQAHAKLRMVRGTFDEMQSALLLVPITVRYE